MNNRLISLFILISVIMVVSIGLFFDLYNKTNFVDGVFVEAHAVIVEILIVVLLLGWWTSYRENKTQLPARILASKKLIDLHIEIFTFLKYTIDPDQNTDPTKHGFKNGTTVEEANAYMRNFFFQFVSPKLKKCQDTLMYTNASLGADLLPQIVSHLEHSEKQISTIESIVQAYVSQSKGGLDEKGRLVKYHVTLDFNILKEMDEIYKIVIKKYPNLKTYVPDAKPHLPLNELLIVIRKAQKEKTFYKINIVNDN